MTTESRELTLEDIAKAIESITLHECNHRTGATAPKSADWLNGNDAGVVRGLKYAAMTVRALAPAAAPLTSPQQSGAK